MPADLKPGNDKLQVYLSKQDNGQILATDFYPVTVTSQPPTVDSVTINEEIIAADNLEKTISVRFSGSEGHAQSFNIPVIVNYSDKTIRYMALTFNYQPSAFSAPVCGKECIYSDENGCHQGNCKDKSQSCDTNSNCGWVDGCSQGGNVDCPANNSQPCDDLYYFDTNVDSCIHKFSNDPYPNCIYNFDHVERNFCP